MSLCTGALGAITTGPSNTLVVRCRDEYVNMSCVSDANDKIAWSYDGNAVINLLCRANTDVFLGERQSAHECNINGSLAKATNDPFIRSISGPYGCTDLSNDGITDTAMAIVIGKLHVVSSEIVYGSLHVNFSAQARHSAVLVIVNMFTCLFVRPSVSHTRGLYQHGLTYDLYHVVAAP